MTLKEMMDAGMIVEVDNNYLTDDGVVIIRCCGAGSSLYWVREDDIYTAYRRIDSAYRKYDGSDIRYMRKSTAYAIMDSVRYYFKYVA